MNEAWDDYLALASVDPVECDCPACEIFRPLSFGAQLAAHEIREMLLRGYP